MSHDIKLIDFKSDDREQILNEDEDVQYSENKFICRMVFTIQMFGINEKGDTYSLTINNFKPYFYIKVPNAWKISDKNKLVDYFRNVVGDYYKDSIVDSALVRKKKLYGFDAQSYHKFVVIRFQNMRCFNKVKNLWYGENKYIVNNFDKSRGAWCLK